MDEFLTVNTIRDFVTNEQAIWDARGEHGWTAERRERIAHLAEGILSRPNWSERAMSGLESDDQEIFWRARQVADKIGIDTWEYSFRRQESGQSEEWYYLMQTDNPAKIDRVIALAKSTIPLDKVATGAALEMGLGPEFKHHFALDFIVDDLRRFPGKGWALVKTSLNSPVVRNRNMAINALAKWGEATVNPALPWRRRIR